MLDILFYLVLKVFGLSRPCQTQLWHFHLATLKGGVLQLAELGAVGNLSLLAARAPDKMFWGLGVGH